MGGESSCEPVVQLTFPATIFNTFHHYCSMPPPTHLQALTSLLTHCNQHELYVPSKGYVTPTNTFITTYNGSLVEGSLKTASSPELK